jgi:hypothetical protein
LSSDEDPRMYQRSDALRIMATFTKHETSEEGRS